MNQNEQGIRVPIESIRLRAALKVIRRYQEVDGSYIDFDGTRRDPAEDAYYVVDDICPRYFRIYDGGFESVDRGFANLQRFQPIFGLQFEKGWM